MLPQAPWRALYVLATVYGVLASPEKDDKSTSSSPSASTTTTATAVATPCVATSSSGAFYDLRDDIAIAAGEGRHGHKGQIEDYVYAKPHDWPYNFTMNVCAPVVKEVNDVVGVDRAMWKNVSAYYEAEGKVYSLG
jgi:cation-dependent mannose-6-phosphate receptor